MGVFTQNNLQDTTLQWVFECFDSACWVMLLRLALSPGSWWFHPAPPHTLRFRCRGWAGRYHTAAPRCPQALCQVSNPSPGPPCSQSYSSHSGMRPERERQIERGREGGRERGVKRERERKKDWKTWILLCDVVFSKRMCNVICWLMILMHYIYPHKYKKLTSHAHCIHLHLQI